MAPQLMERIDDRGGLDEGNLTVVPQYRLIFRSGFLKYVLKAL